jgi:hypothetical protein
MALFSLDALVDMGMATEMVSAEFIGFNLGEVLKDIDDLTAPGIEPAPTAVTNSGGQLTLPM